MTIASSSNYAKTLLLLVRLESRYLSRVRVVVRASARVLVLWGKVRIVELGESVRWVSGDLSRAVDVPIAVGFTLARGCRP